MEIFKQNKLLKITIIILVLFNIITISTIVWKDFIKKPLPRKNENRESNENLDISENKDVSAILKEELSLTENQAEQIKKLRTDFFEKEKILESQIRSERDSLNSTMFNKNTDEEFAKSLARRIADNEYSMELLRFEQAQKFKSICTPEQLEKFEGLVKEIRDYFKPDNPQKDKQKKKDNR
jgi:Spy/CpxP family protein refolding chaperone